MDDVLKAMREGGFKPQANVDEDFPALKGEYRVDVKALKPWTDKKITLGDGETCHAYMLELRVTETLSGDKGDNRNFTRFYRVAGLKFDPKNKDARVPTVTLEQADKIEAIKSLCNDIFTLEGAPQLDTSSISAMEASFGTVIGAVGYVRAWHRPKQSDTTKNTQYFVLKAEKDLSKNGKIGAAAERTPY